MGRRTSGQQVGLQSIGNIQASANTLTTTQTNQNLTIDPNGTGTVEVQSSVTINGDMSIANQGDLRLLEASGNGTNYIALQAAASMAANYTLTWPAAVSGSNGFVLTSQTDGTLSWASAGGNISVSDSGSTATVHYPLFGTNAGALPSTLSPLARANLAFVPSTGELTATIGNFANVYGSTSNSGTVTIRGTSSATKATASVLMTDNVASSSTTTGTLVITGGIGISGQMTATSIVETSSIAFKENINPIENALDLIMNLVGVTYDRKDNKEHEAGLIAEHVFKHAPDLVSLDKNGEPYGIKYTKLGAYLIESIKSLKTEIEELKGKK
jgi:hypothetical protein